MMIDKERRFIFIHIPKTGGTSVETFFMPSERDRIRNIYGNTPLQSDNQAHLKFYHLQIQYPRLNFDKYFKFTVVRNPWDRVVSNFFHSKREHRQDLRKFLGFGIWENFTFNEFVEKIQHLEKEHPHYDEQWSFLVDRKGRFCMDYIARMENLENDFMEICQKLKITDSKIPHVNKGKGGSYTQYYNDETKQIIAEKYAKDIELFGYKFGE